MTSTLTTAVARILLTTWDPIGIQDEPRAQDEYDAYVPHVVRLLETRASTQAIASYLLSLERDRMALNGDPKKALAAAQRLSALAV